MTSPHYDADPRVARFPCNSHKQIASICGSQSQLEGYTAHFHISLPFFALCTHILLCTVTFKQTLTRESRSIFIVTAATELTL